MTYVAKLVSFLLKTCMVTQESVVLSEMLYYQYYDMLASVVVLSRFFKKMAYFNIKRRFYLRTEDTYV